MTKFSLRRFPPSLFDVSQDIVRALPVDIIERWTRGDQSRETALELLEPQTRTGTAVVSDSAGLTRLGAHRGLIEILAMISRPKELIHAHGVAIGGGGIGVWAADNTQMFCIYLTPAAAGRAGVDAGAPRLTLTVSGVSVDACVV